MSSSTKIHGAGIRRPSQIRTAAETTTMPPRTAQTGIARTQARVRASATLLAKPDLAQGARHTRGLLDPDLSRRGRNLVEHGVPDGRAAGRILERGDVP